MAPYTEQPGAGHNESAVRLAALAGDAKIARDRVAKGEADAVDGWLAYGAALNEGRSIFASDKEFGQWIEANDLHLMSTFDLRREAHAGGHSSNVGRVELHPAERAAAMWAAANADQLAEAKAACNARTLRGWHDQWKKIERAREEERLKAEREAEEARKREEARKAKEEAAALERAEAEARAAAQAAKTEEERQAAEAKAEEAATARADAEKAAEEAEVAVAPEEPQPEPDPLAGYREGLSGLTREGLEDEVAGLRADLAETKAKLKQARSEIVRLKELNASFTGDSAEVIRRMSREIEHKNSEMFRAKEDTAAAMRQVYVLKKRVAELESMEVVI